MNGIVFDIQRCSLNDGPGIRTTVFLKGCPLRCIWCHNPESYHPEPQVMYIARKCTLCGRCAVVCPQHSVSPAGHEIDRAGCIACGHCAEVCLCDAIEICGRTMSVEEVLAEVRKDRLFYRTSGGGLTLSGGEPMFQADFALALAKAAQEEGIHVAVETSGMCRWDVLEGMLPYTDLFLFDCKETDPARHRAFTGADNTLILENLRRLNDSGAHIILRCPIIPGCNDREEHLKAIATLAGSLDHVQRIDVEPFHPLGLGKEAQLGIAPRMEVPDTMPADSQVEEWMEFLRARTDIPVAKA